MSQIAAVRALPRPSTVRTPHRDLRVVAGAPASRAGLVALCLALLTAGLVAVLLLNTSMAQGSYLLGSLQAKSSELADTESALRHAVDAQGAPAELAKRAMQLGMVPASSAAFLRVSDGQVLGVAQPATADRGFTVVAQAKPVSPAPAAAASAAPATPAPESGTTVSTEGTVTRTTVTVVRGDVVERTVTSVDSASGVTTSTTSRTPVSGAASATPAR